MKLKINLGHVQLHTLKITTVLVYHFLEFRLFSQSGYLVFDLRMQAKIWRVIQIDIDL